MKKIFTLIFIIIYGFVISQTHRFIYELAIQKNGKINKTNMVLDIDKNFVKFYDYEFLKVDSIRKNKNENIQIPSESDQLILRKNNSFENKRFHTYGYDYFVITSMDKLDWKVEKERKKVGDFTLQKATANFGGRMWTAWYNSEIPFQEGPYKFRGLPGLIFEVYDSEDIFHYSMVKSESLSKTFETKAFLETHYGNKPISITLEQYHKLKLDHYNNIVEVLNQYREKGVSIAPDNELSTKEEISRKRKSLQDNIKKYYLPIEKDNAIPYP
ncbi:GLPGLI family protein [Elizabethkingia anophelis]|nr:GLPGLI family protein [Elizabethkingia anophelis]